MPQLSLYLDEEAMAQLRTDACRENKTLSSYVRDALTSRASAWPESFWKTYGALKDPSFQLPDNLDEAWDRPTPSFD